MTQGFRGCFRNFGRGLKLSAERRDTVGGQRGGSAACFCRYNVQTTAAFAASQLRVGPINK